MSEHDDQQPPPPKPRPPKVASGPTEWDDAAPWEEPKPKPKPKTPDEAEHAEAGTTDPDTTDAVSPDKPASDAGGFAWDTLGDIKPGDAPPESKQPDSNTSQPAPARDEARAFSVDGSGNITSQPAPARDEALTDAAPDVFHQPTPPPGPPPPTPMPTRGYGAPSSPAPDAPPASKPSLPDPTIYQPSYEDTPREKQPAQWQAPAPAPAEMPKEAYDPEQYAGFVPSVSLPRQEVEQPEIRAWTLVETLGWIISGVMLWFVLQFFTVLLLSSGLVMLGVKKPPSAGFMAFVLTGASLLFIPLCAGLSMFRGIEPGDYLRMRLPKWYHAAAGVAGIALLYLAADLTVPEDIQRDTEKLLHELIGKETGRWLALVAVLLFAPLWEEVFFRGFIFRGLEVSAVRWPGAVIITAAAWAVLHINYGLINVAVIFIAGLFLGSIRAWSQSTWLAIGLHFQWNTIVAATYLMSLKP